MITLFIYTIAAFGLAYIVGFSKISLPVRLALDPGNKISSFYDLLRKFVLALIECPACIGFWIGLVSAATWMSPQLEVFSNPAVTKYRFLWMLVLAAFTCGANFILGTVTGLITED